MQVTKEQLKQRLLDPTINSVIVVTGKPTVLEHLEFNRSMAIVIETSYLWRSGTNKYILSTWYDSLCTKHERTEDKDTPEQNLDLDTAVDILLNGTLAYIDAIDILHNTKEVVAYISNNWKSIREANTAQIYQFLICGRLIDKWILDGMAVPQHKKDLDRQLRELSTTILGLLVMPINRERLIVDIDAYLQLWTIFLITA